MKVGGQIPWNAIPSAKRSRSLIWWEKLHTKDVLENLSQDQSFRLVHWLSVTMSLRRISQESINLERKSYLDCSSDTLSTREEFGRVTYWLQTLRSWKRRTHRKSTQKDSMQKRWYFPNKENLFFQPQMDWYNSLERRSGTENIHLDTGAPNSRRRSKRFSRIIRRVSTSTNSRLTSRCRWSTKRFVGHFRKLHIPPSRWTQSRILLAERRITPCSTEIHWRLQNYTYKLGCFARTPHRWLLEYRLIQRFVWFLDRFHSVSSIGRETSRRIYVVPEETDKKAADIQANSGRNWEEMPSWRRSKSGHMKSQNLILPENYEEIISLTPRTRNSRKPSRMLARNWNTPMTLAMRCKTSKNSQHGVTLGKSNEIKSKLACILEAESTRLRMGESLPNHHEDHIAGKRENSLQHYNVVHIFIPMPQALKIHAAKAVVVKEWENWRKFRSGTWRKSEVRKRWSMKPGRRAWPGGWRPHGMRPTGGGGLARVPNLRVCKHPFRPGWHHRGVKDELTSCRGTV